MNKKIISTLLITLVVLLFLGCAKQPAPEAPPVGAVEEVETGISDITAADQDLDSSELDDIDTILEDIGNI